MKNESGSEYPLVPSPSTLDPRWRPPVLSTPEEAKPEIASLWRSIARRKWMVASLTLGMAVLGGAVSYGMRPVYQSTATVMIEAGKPKILAIDEVYSSITQDKEHYQTQVEILKSREIAARVVRMLSLWNQPEFDPRRPDPDDFWVRLGVITPSSEPALIWDDVKLENAAVKRVMSDLIIDPVRQSQLVKISYESTNKVLATRIANAIAEQYIEFDKDERTKLTQQVNSQLRARMEELRGKLTESEIALQRYRDQQGLVSLSGSAQTMAGQQIENVTQRLVDARSRRAELESAYREIKRAAASDYAGIPAVVRDTAVSEALAKVNDAKRRVAELSQQLGSEHLTLKTAKSELTQLQRTLTQRRAAVVESIMREYDASRRTEKEFESMLSTARTGVQSVNRQEFELHALERDVETNKQLYDMFMGRAKETNLTGDLQGAIARVVDRAQFAESPVRPRKLQVIAVSGLLGTLLGTVIALVLGKLDKSLKTPEDAEIRLHLNVVTSLPILSNKASVLTAKAFLDSPESLHAEAIRTARTAVWMSNPGLPHKTILVTSSLAGEGKTTLCTNLALAHAQTQRTLLIDADMRHPQVGRQLGLDAHAKGLSNVVAGTADVRECLHRVPGSQLLVMPVGDVPPNPLEMLSSHRFRDAMSALAERFDIIIIDSPPVGLVSDALVLAPTATSTIFVVKAMTTPLPVARRALARLQGGGASMLGIALNQVEPPKRYRGSRSDTGYPGGYGYGGYQPIPELANR